MKKILMLLVLMIFAECSYAGFKSGNDLVTNMVEFEKAENDQSNGKLINWYSFGAYLGYVIGVADATDSIIWCAPEHITQGQIAKVVAKYLGNHPEKLHLSATSLVIESLISTFPCKK